MVSVANSLFFVHFKNFKTFKNFELEDYTKIGDRTNLAGRP